MDCTQCIFTQLLNTLQSAKFFSILNVCSLQILCVHATLCTFQYPVEKLYSKLCWYVMQGSEALGELVGYKRK